MREMRGKVGGWRKRAFKCLTSQVFIGRRLKTCPDSEGIETQKSRIPKSGMRLFLFFERMNVLTPPQNKNAFNASEIFGLEC